MENITNKNRLTKSGISKWKTILTQDETQPASQAMLYGAGFTDEDMKKAQVGIASTGFEGNTCNMHLNELASHVKEGVIKCGMVGLIFNTIGVSDGMSMGTNGMFYSLPSRDVIADSIEAISGAHFYDALITVVGCDKKYARNSNGTKMAISLVLIQ